MNWSPKSLDLGVKLSQENMCVYNKWYYALPNLKIWDSSLLIQKNFAPIHWLRPLVSGDFVMDIFKTGLKDNIEYLTGLSSSWTKIISKLIKHGPINSYKNLKKYPWLITFIKIHKLLHNFTKGRYGLYRQANTKVISVVVSQLLELLDGIRFHEDRLILHEDLVPSEIFRAMGLYPWMVEMMGILMPMVDSHSMEKYIDIAENEGIPPDICSLPKGVIGMAIEGSFPNALAVITSNSPCDGGMSSYTIIERKMKIPVYRLDVPYNFYNKRAVNYFANELKKMINWLEENTPGKMDWDLLKEICEQRNKMKEYELELWEMIRTRPAPLAGEPVYLSHLWAYNVYPGTKENTELFKTLSEIAKKNYEIKKGAIPNEKYRAVLWNPPLLHFIDFFSWAEQKYGVSLIIDSMSYNNQPFIDTSSPETMLNDLASNIMQGPMARHTRGPAKNYLDDIFHIYKHFDLDMVWVAGHIGCKNTAALNGILREKCREAGIPLLVINYDLSDPRVETHDGIKKQVDQFMENIMKVKIN